MRTHIVDKHMHTYTCMQTYTHTYTCVKTHTQTLTHAHTFTHTHVRAHPELQHLLSTNYCVFTGAVPAAPATPYKHQLQPSQAITSAVYRCTHEYCSCAMRASCCCRPVPGQLIPAPPEAACVSSRAPEVHCPSHLLLRQWSHAQQLCAATARPGAAVPGPGAPRTTPQTCGRVCTTVMLPSGPTTPSTSCALPRATSMSLPTLHILASSAFLKPGSVTSLSSM